VKVLYNNFQDLTWIEVFQKLDELNNFEPTLIIDNKNFINNSKKIFPNSFFIDMDECLLNYKKKEEYLSIINHRIFKAHKNIAYDLLSRFSTNNEKSFSVREKEELYYGTITFWYEYLRNKKFDLFMCKLAPHHFYDYIIYLCCKILNIKTLFFSGTIIKYHFRIKSKINNRSLIGSKESKSNCKTHETILKIKENNFLHNYVNKKPWYIKKYQFLNNDFNKYIIKYYFKLIANFLRLSFLKKSDFLMKEPKKKLKKYTNFFSKFDYDRYIINTSFKKKKLFQLYNQISSYPDLKKKVCIFCSSLSTRTFKLPSWRKFSRSF
jgi:hypothetical protein